jgi:hypothetical protein
MDGSISVRSSAIVCVRLAPNGDKEKATTWVALHGEGIRLRFVGSAAISSESTATRRGGQ